MGQLEIRFWSLSRDLYTMWEHIRHGQMVVKNTVLDCMLYCRYVYCCMSNLVVEIRTYFWYYTTVWPWELENLCSSLFKRPFLGVVVCRADVVALISEDPLEWGGVGAASVVVETSAAASESAAWYCRPDDETDSELLLLKFLWRPSLSLAATFLSKLRSRFMSPGAVYLLWSFSM